MRACVCVCVCACACPCVFQSTQTGTQAVPAPTECHKGLGATLHGTASTAFWGWSSSCELCTKPMPDSLALVLLPARVQRRYGGGWAGRMAGAGPAYATRRGAA